MLLWNGLYFFIFIVKVFCEEKIIGGNTVNDLRYLYQVALRKFTPPQYICGGSVISETWVLTAGHCVAYETPEIFLVVGGTIYLNEAGIAKNVSSYIVHENYDANSLAFNIAVVNVITPFTFGRYIQPIKLASHSNVPPPRTYVMLTGWGRTSDYPFNILPPNQLQVLSAKYISLEECQRYNPIYENQPDHLISIENVCTLNGFDEGTCYGDSGSPLVYLFWQIGIVSFVHDLCSTSKPSVYTSVPHFKDWIVDKTGITPSL